jgi:hypothetical protein
VREVFAVQDLRPVTDSYLVEFIGGPNDGDFRPANENGYRPGGLYVPLNDITGRIVARIYVPRSEGPMMCA